ncbi:MAG: hypothetical protein B7Y40_04660 [Gammaproteobacteria bacterium 28-57-27]|nr:MAG: hypothetical protein B7Y40_04660 [Gammaproteobacteria bacterium 28-57-27]
MKVSNSIMGLIMGAGLLASPSFSVMAAEGLKPFLAAPAQEGSVKQVSDQLKAKLKEAGFSMIADYAPMGSARVLAVSNEALKKSAAKGERSAYGVAMRVSLLEKDGKVSVSCTNPEYLAAAYHMNGNAQEVKKLLEAAVGCNEPFGAGVMSASDIGGYHYAIGMEYLDDVYDLGEFASFEEAKKAVETGLAANKMGVTKVYRVEIPGKSQVVYGVALNTKKTNMDADDGVIMAVLDQGGRNRLGYLPYEILVNDKKVEALHMRYRAALYFPELPMLGEGASFFKLQNSPDAIGEVLRETVGVKSP